jgi:hypothetical protein
MTLFEYISGAISIVLALAVARTVDGLRSSIEPGRRYWVHATWVILKLMEAPSFWWGMWGYRDASTWNIVSFTLALALPLILYLQVTGLVGRQPELVSDWRRHFNEQRKWFFGTNICLGVVVFGLQATLSVVPADLPSAILNIGVLIAVIFSVVGIASENPKVHAVIVVVAAINFTLGLSVPMFRPLSLS